MTEGSWPWEAVAAVIASAVTLAIALGRGLFKLCSQWGDSSFREHERGWQRASELETEIRLLRIALHRAQQRGSDKSTALEICVLAMPLPLEDRIRAVKQARLILEGSFKDGEL